MNKIRHNSDRSENPFISDQIKTIRPIWSFPPKYGKVRAVRYVVQVTILSIDTCTTIHSSNIRIDIDTSF